MRTISVMVVIPVHNRRALTLGCLRSLEAADHTGLDLRVVVVDDGSSDGTGDAVRSGHPDVEVVVGDGSLHYSAATNVGIRVALRHTPDFVLAMNDDAVVPADLLTRLVATASCEPRSVVGPALVEWDDDRTVFQVAPRWRLAFGGFQHRFGLRVDDLPESPFEVETMAGNCMLIPRAALEDVGLQPADRLPFWGDAGLSRRLRGAGWRLVVDPAARLPCEPNRPPQPLRAGGTGAALRSLFIDGRHPVNLRRQFWLRWESAPTRSQAVLAFGVHVARLARKAFGFGRWPDWPDPPDPFGVPPPVKGRRRPIR